MGTNSYSSSISALNTIATKYDSGTSGYTVTNPLTGASGFVLELRYNWKSYTSAASASYPIYAQKLLYSDGVYPAMANLKSASAKAQDNSYLASASSSLSSVSSFSSQVSSFKSQVYDYGGNGDTIVSAAQLGFTIYYAVVMGCAIAMVVGIVLFAFCGCAKCRCISHLGWCLLAFFMIIGFIFGTLFFPVSVVIIEACDLINPSNLQTDRGIIPSNVWDEIGICLTGNGDLYTKYDLASKMDFATTITNAFSLVSALYNPTAGTLVYNITDAFVAYVLTVLIHLIGHKY